MLLQPVAYHPGPMKGAPGLYRDAGHGGRSTPAAAGQRHPQPPRHAAEPVPAPPEAYLARLIAEDMLERERGEQSGGGDRGADQAALTGGDHQKAYFTTAKPPTSAIRNSTVTSSRRFSMKARIGSP